MQFAAAPWRLGFSRPAASSLQEEQGPDVSRQPGKKGAALARRPEHPCTSPGARVQEQQHPPEPCTQEQQHLLDVGDTPNPL